MTIVSSVALCVVLLFTACNAVKTGELLPQPPVLNVVIPESMKSGVNANWSAQWIGGTAPYRLQWEFGGGAEPDEIEQNGLVGTTAVQNIEMRNSAAVSAEFLLTVTITDSAGLSSLFQTHYSIAARDNTAPVIASKVFDPATRQLLVAVEDPDGDDVTVSLTTAAHLVPSPFVQVVEGGSGEALFSFSSDDIFLGASGVVLISADDGRGAPTTDNVDIEISGMTPLADRLFALPLDESVRVGESVRIVVATGATANEFLNMGGVGLTVNDDAEYVEGSFNAGALGGAPNDVDGLWADTGATELFTFADALIEATPLGAARERYDFRIVPFDGVELPFAEGALFSFELSFSEPGVKHLAFQQGDGVERTYYQNGVAGHLFWGDLSNEGFGEITVTE
jgi:hypothetical protein